MTTPMPGFDEAEPLIEPTYYRLKITNTDEARSNISQAMHAALAQGIIHYGAPEGRYNPVSGQVELLVKTTDANGVDYFADPGDYVVLTYNGDQLCALTLYNGPNGTRTTNTQYSDMFHAEEAPEA